jgi:hypothetical protein
MTLILSDKIVSGIFEQRLCWEGTCSAIQEIFCLLWNPKPVTMRVMQIGYKIMLESEDMSLLGCYALSLGK